MMDSPPENPHGLAFGIIVAAGYVLLSLVLLLSATFGEYVGPAVAALIAVTIIAVVTAGVAWFVGRSAGIRGRIAAVVFGLFTIMLMYALIYQWLYLRKPSNFFVAAQITSSKT